MYVSNASPERNKCSSKAIHEFARAIADQDKQIAWVEHQIVEQAGETRSDLPPESHSFTSTPITPIQIDNELRALIPPLASEERSQLEANLAAEGCRDPLVVWKGHHILLDGHNRYEICATQSIDFKTVEIDLPDRDAAHDWLITNQLGRRNLTPEAVSYLRGKRYNQKKRQGERTDLTSRQSGTKLTSRQSGEKLSKRLASEYKVGSRTIERDAEFALAVDTLAYALGEEIRQDLLSRDAQLTKKDTLNLAKVAANNPEQAKSAISSIKACDQMTVAHHLRLVEGELVEIHAPNSNKIHSHLGRIAAVRERTVEVWLRDIDTMVMTKYTLKPQQVTPLPLEKEPRLEEICNRLSKLRSCSLDPFEVEIINLLKRNVALTPLELEYLVNIEKRHGITHIKQRPE